MTNGSVTTEEEKSVKALGFLRNRGTNNFSGRVITVNGKITAEQMICLSEAAKLYGNGVVTMTTRQTIECQGIPFDKIEDFRACIAKAGLASGGTGPKVRPVVCCKGTTCQYGLIDAFALSEEIHERFYNGYRTVKLPHKFKIAVGGCPNNCVKPELNDVGVIGQLIPNFDAGSCKGCKKCAVEMFCPIGAAKLKDGLMEIDEKKCNHCGRCIGKCGFGAIKDGTLGYKIYIGGRWGKSTAVGEALGKIFTDKEEALTVIERAILLFRERGKAGERFASVISRLGFEYVERELLERDIMSRKEAILESAL
ncbi:MAG: 4Fe-4S binding protein [Synergistaceae bacterium]|nr:4Fe-4S binding protein [Synergistaceae bacterium]